MGALVFEEQDLGELTPTLREAERVSVSRDVEILCPDESKSHIDAMEAFRDVIDEHYGEHLSRLAAEDERVIVTEIRFSSDELPVIEYSTVEK